MRALRSAALALPLCWLALGCGVKTSYVATNPPPHPMQAREPGSVQIYSTQLPDRPYAEVGLIEATGRNAAVEMDEIIAELRAKAAEVGCDAIILTGARNEVAGTSGGLSTRKGHSATCVVFRRQGAAAPTAAATGAR